MRHPALDVMLVEWALALLCVLFVATLLLSIFTCYLNELYLGKPKTVIVFCICSRFQICSIAFKPSQCPLRRSCRCLAKFATASTNTASNQRLYNFHGCLSEQRSLTNMFASDCTAAFATCAGKHAQNSGQCTWPRRSLSSTRSPRISSSIPSILD